MIIRVVAVFAVLSGPAFAVSCPPSSDGRRLAPVEGGTVYIGDPAKHMMVTPYQEAGKSNVWLMTGAKRLMLMCRYEDGRAVVLSLPAVTRQCVEDLAAREMTCR